MSLSLTEVAARATAAAKTHQEEFPGQDLAGDWDAEALAIAGPNWNDEQRAVYLATLRAEVARLVYVARAGGLTGAVEHEDACLSIGDDLLPACAKRVRRGKTPTAEYWRWLTGQLDTGEDDAEELGLVPTYAPGKEMP